jgi:hypothetical protein
MATQSETDMRTVMPVQELHGRVVWDEAGEKLGVVHDVVTDEHGKIDALELRSRWMFGPHRHVAASGMRLEGGDIVVPVGAAGRFEARDRAATPLAGAAALGTSTPTAQPVLVSGRAGARGRYGGVDLLGSLFGALVAFASLVIIGGVLTVLFDVDLASYDTSVDSWSDVFNEAAIIGGVTIFLAFLLGGWAAGRSSRFDGVANGLLVTAWFLGIGLVLGAIGAWADDKYDIYRAGNLPGYANDSWALAGTVGVVVGILLMLLGGVVGGMIGEGWHRRADRAMFDPVGVAEDDTTVAPTV